jgi:hypothetical protein
VARRSRLVVPGRSVLAVLIGFAPLVAGCGGPSSESVVHAVRFDPCRPLALVLDENTSVARVAGVRTAGDLWNLAAGSLLSVDGAASPAGPPGAPPAAAPAGSGPTLPVHFEVAAAPSHGYFDPVLGQVLVNDDLMSRPLAVTVAHEIGHAFGLVHVTGRPSVMNPGNLDVEPNAGDVAALAALWGPCDAGPAP